MTKRLCIVLVSIVVLLCGFCQVSYADTENAKYITERFDVQVEITENHVFHFEETIDVDFNQEQHGIYRYITKDESAYSIKHVDVEKHPYEIFDEDELLIQIGHPDVLVAGKQSYPISYDIVGFKDRDKRRDLLYLDVLPTGWETPVEEANIVVKFPKAFDAESLQVYAGKYGTGGNLNNIQYGFDDDGLILTLTAEQLEKGNGITISAELPEGYWINPKNHDWPMYVILACLLLSVAIFAWCWYRHGRDEAVVKVIEFYPPEGMTPAELGYVIEGISTNDQMSAMILYFADKGYLSIEEKENDKFELLQKVKKLPNEEPLYAKTLYNGLFKKGERVRLDEMHDGIADVYEKAEEQLDKLFERKDRLLFTEESFNLQTKLLVWYMVLAVIPCTLTEIFCRGRFVADVGDCIGLLLVLGFSALMSALCFMLGYGTWHTSDGMDKVITLGISLIALGVQYWINLYSAYILFGSILYCIAFVASTLVMLVFLTLMTVRTKESSVLLGRILGFRDFIKTAELDRLKTLSKENPEYFYHIMPYAYVLGLSDCWTKSFMGQIVLEKPDWYIGKGMGGGDLIFYSRLTNRCMNSISDSIDQKILDETDNEGGFGSGGFFSGGGFGGGGGGSW